MLARSSSGICDNLETSAIFPEQEHTKNRIKILNNFITPFSRGKEQAARCFGKGEALAIIHPEASFEEDEDCVLAHDDDNDFLQ